MAVYARKDGTLYVQFFYKGKTYIKSTGGKNKQKAAALEVKMRQDLFDLTELGNPEEITLQAAIDLYLTTQLKKTTIGTIRSILKWYTPHINKMMLHDVNTAWLHKIIDIKRTESSSNGTLKVYLQQFCNVLKNAETLGFRVSSFVKPKIGETKSRLRFLTLEEETRLLNALDVNHIDCRANSYGAAQQRHRATIQDDYDLAVLLLDTGARLNEIQKIEWGKIDLNTKTIHVWRTKVRNESYLKMTDRVFEVLNRRKNTATSEYVFTDVDGGYRKSSQGLRKTMTDLGLEACSMHTLRHTHASRLVQAGVSLYEVQQLLGHTNIATTMKYSHLSQADITSKAADVLNGIHNNRIE